jgi:hypothetical protein
MSRSRNSELWIPYDPLRVFVVVIIVDVVFPVSGDGDREGGRIGSMRRILRRDLKVWAGEEVSQREGMLGW